MGRVYSTDQGRLCPGCLRPKTQCQCKDIRGNSVIADGSKVRIRLDRKGRGGKEVSVISGLPLTSTELATLNKSLKRQCGTGGAVKDGNVELQGDHRQKLLTLLEQQGYKPKLAGG